jgi:hypothetical protein
MDPNGYGKTVKMIFSTHGCDAWHAPHLGQSLNGLHIQVVGGFIHCDEMRLGPEPAAMAIVFTFFSHQKHGKGLRQTNRITGKKILA